MRSFEIKEEIYTEHILFITDCDIKRARTFLKEKYRFIDTEEFGTDTCDGLTVSGYHQKECKPGKICKHPCIFVWVEKSSDLTVVVHELFHLVVRICYRNNIKIEHKSNDEPVAFLMDFFWRKWNEHSAIPTRKKKRSK